MRITAKVDYAVRALCELAARSGDVRPVKGEVLAQAQEIPQSFLENILAECKRGGLLITQRGQEGGYRFARPPGQISVADVIRVVEGPLADVRGERPETLAYTGAATVLTEVWLATRANLRAVLEHVTIADIAAGELPGFVAGILADPDTRQRR
jgi:Rrf2 family protein